MVPSPPWQCCKSSKEEATARAAVQANMPLHRMRHACSARGVLARWPKHSQTFWSPRTNDRQLPEQRPQVAPVHEGVSAFFSLPGCLESHPIMRVRSPSWRAIAVQHTHHGGVNGHLGPTTHRQTNRRPPPPICVHPKHSALGRPCHGSLNLCALVRQLPCRCVP